MRAFVRRVYGRQTGDVMKTLIVGLVGLAGLLGSGLAAAADGGDWLVRGGISAIDPRENSKELRGDGEPSGYKVGVNGDTQLGVGVEYRLTPSWGLELFTTTPFKHTSELLGFIDLIEFKQVPLVLSAIYHLPAASGLYPYLGVGVNYTVFYDEQWSSDLQGYGSGSAEQQNSFGVALQMGVDYPVNERWLVNLAVRWLEVDSDVDIRSDGGNRLRADMNIDPMLYSASLGYTF